MSLIWLVLSATPESNLGSRHGRDHLRAALGEGDRGDNTSQPPTAQRHVRHLQRVSLRSFLRSLKHMLTRSSSQSLTPASPSTLSTTISHLLPDPTLFESHLCTSHITIVVSSTTSKLLHVYQAGAPLSSAGADGEGGGREQLQACIALARSRAKGLLEILA